MYKRQAQWRVKEAEAAMLSAKLAYLPSFALSPQGTASSFDKGKAIFDEDTMERIQQYMNGEITTSTIAKIYKLHRISLN